MTIFYTCLYKLFSVCELMFQSLVKHFSFTLYIVYTEERDPKISIPDAIKCRNEEHWKSVCDEQGDQLQHIQLCGKK